MVDGKNQASQGDEDLEKIMQEINSIEQESNYVETGGAAVRNIADHSRAKTTDAGSSPQSLTLELNGTLQLKLIFTSGARSMELSCNEDGLTCRLADGSEFRVPLTQGSATRKTA